MIEALSRELITWLGYLQRTAVLMQVAIVVIAVIADKRARWTRKLHSEFLVSVSHLITPGLLILLGMVMKWIGVPGGYLQYLALIWLIWRLIKPTNLLLKRRFPKLPVEQLDQALFRPVLVVFTVISFFQILGSRESLSIIELGEVFGVTLTVGKLLTALVITYLIRPTPAGLRLLWPGLGAFSWV